MTEEICIQFVDELAASGDAQAQAMLMPKKGSEEAAGYDLVAANMSPLTLKPGERTLVPTGFAMAMRPGLEAQVRPRSGLAFKHGVTVLNAPGTIDSDYRGEVKVILANQGQEDFVVTRGMRVAQMVIAQVCPVKASVVETLPKSMRGEGGFGSTGM